MTQNHFTTTQSNFKLVQIMFRFFISILIFSTFECSSFDAENNFQNDSNRKSKIIFSDSNFSFKNIFQCFNFKNENWFLVAREIFQIEISQCLKILNLNFNFQIILLASNVFIIISLFFPKRPFSPSNSTDNTSARFLKSELNIFILK